MLRAAIIPPDEVLAELHGLGNRLGATAGVPATPHGGWDVQLAGFGNVSEADARRLGRVLADELAAVPAPLVWFTAPQREGRDILAPLAGQVGEMTELARIVHRLAASVNLYVDRRRFRPALVMAAPDEVATAPPARSEPVVLPATSDWSGMLWEAGGVSLVRTRWTDQGARAEEFSFIELGHPVDHTIAPA